MTTIPRDVHLRRIGLVHHGHYHLRHEQLLAPPQRPLPGRLAQGPGFEVGAGFNEEGEVNMALFPDEPGASADCSHFSWSLPVQELLRAGQLRTLSLEFALSLKRPAALRLARYLGKKAFDGKEAFEIGLARLCGMHLGMTPRANALRFECEDWLG